MLLSVLAVGFAAPVAAVGPNQNDLNSGGDLPDNTSVNITNYIFTSTYTGSGELDYGDDNDILKVALSANEGLSATLSFPSSTSFPNGSTTYNDFDLYFYDSQLNTMGSSWGSNPETLSTNTSSSPHGGMVYIDISRYSGTGTWNLTLSKFNTSSSSGGGGSSVSNCSGAGTVTSDILEPNDNTSTATSASLLPLSCTGLSIHSTSDVDYFEIDMIAGVTYYVNVSLVNANGDLDIGWESATGSYLTGSGSSANVESMQLYASTNQTTYVRVYGWLSATNTYDIEITTDNPGGGQAFETVDVVLANTTSATITFAGLTNGTTYNYNYQFGQQHLDGIMYGPWNTTVNGTFTANGTTYVINLNTTATHNESYFVVQSSLFDSSGSRLDIHYDLIYIEMAEASVISSTMGMVNLTNLSTTTNYDVNWYVLDYFNYLDYLNNVSNNTAGAYAYATIDNGSISVPAGSQAFSQTINWTGPTTSNRHYLIVDLFVNGTTASLTDYANITGVHFVDFIPQLPALVIDSYSMSPTSANNSAQAKGMDLVVGDGYRYQYRVTDASGANLAFSSMQSFTATAHNMSLPYFSYSTPNASGGYCVHIDLYSNTSVQLIGDRACFYLTKDDDGDGVPNELDNCPGTASGSLVDFNGCALSQKDTDGDGYNDDVDPFPNDGTQWSDMDGDGHGDNASGNNPDAFPSDGSQWSDVDGDGYGDNPSGAYPDAFPTDPTQWSDADGDGYGDNASGNNPDAWPSDSTQWSDSDGDGYGDNPAGTNGDAFPTDSSQWSDADGDGYGDNPNGTTPDAFPSDGTQWRDSDGDGYGDNYLGNNADAFPTDPSQWSDRDGDGYGDNQAGTSPDAFPDDSTQWTDADGDGYGDNAAGLNADAFPSDATQWRDVDNDGYGDNANGNNPDLCLDTPAGEVVDQNGCSSSQLDADMDGVSDAKDACPDTPAGEAVDNVGCSGSQEDADNDGVMDAFDACPNTPLGSEVDAAGCALSQLDTDDDSISDDIDVCPTTTAGEPVNGVGCAAHERDTDDDGVTDDIDACANTPGNEQADAQGCSPSQKDSDGDDVYDNADNCPATQNGAEVDLLGCAENQRDADNDQISDAEDSCPVTPSGEQVDASGCSSSQRDEDNDDIMDNKDLCPDTQSGQAVDIDGCSERQKDDDDDGLKNYLDDCPNTMKGELIDVVGCADSQLDSDGDGVTDDLDAFKYDANESEDADGDGIADRWDAYPEDPTRSQAEAEASGNGMTYALVALTLLGVLGGGGYFYTRKPSVANPFETQSEAADTVTEQHMMTEAKDVPSIETTQPQQWEENGVHWSQDEQGNLSYYDAASATWVPYQT